VVWPVVACTGHRAYPPDVVPWVRAKLRDAAVWLRDQRGCRTAVCGMAVGGDLWWAQAALDAGLALHAHVPFPQQPDRWPPAWQAVWRDVRARAAREVVYGDRYDVRLLYARNDGMLASADAVLAVWDPSRPRGGTWSAVRRAARLGLPVVHVDPGARRVAVLDPGGLAGLLAAGRGGVTRSEDAVVPHGEAL
jgi:hypothetical protein